MSIFSNVHKVRTLLKRCGVSIHNVPNSSKSFKYKINQKGTVAVLITVLTCGTVLYLVEISMLKKKISTVTNVFDLDKQAAQYISLFDTTSLNIQASYFPLSKSVSTDPWHLLQLAQSQSRSSRHFGVKSLAEIDTWEDYQYRYIAQAVDRKTLIGLARSCDIDPQFFLSEPKQTIPKSSLSDELSNLLTSLPGTCEDKCVEYFTRVALKHGKPPDDKGGFWSFGGKTLASADIRDRLSEKTVELCSLQALVKHSTIRENCIEMVEKGGLALLQRIVADKPKCLKTQILVAKILANVSLINSLHQYIIISGWISKLAMWIKSKSLPLSSLAAKTLSNMDRDFTSYIQEDGVYVFHPVHRTSTRPTVDVVLVHGVLGGSFKTWRQEGYDINKLPEENSDLSPCWPKDWLAKDVGNIRIICIDYDTHLSEWYAECPYDIQKRSLASRGDEMIEKLKKAGVGDRPIIWAGHSLGGLLIKQILSKSIEDTTGQYQGIKEQTKGVIFYGVPHQGSSIPTTLNKASYILHPSVEVKELHQNSPHLQYLHSTFLNLMKSQSIPCLTFGELRKTDIGKNLPKVHIIPPGTADTGYGEFYEIDVDHRCICKPDDRQSDIYTRTLHFVKQSLFQCKYKQYYQNGIQFITPKSLEESDNL